MATFPRTLRRGLPRHPRGEAWPPVGTALPSMVEPESGPADPATSAPQSGVVGVSGVDASKVTAERSGGSGVVPALRRGLPRVKGGDAWPPASAAPVASAGSAGSVASAAPVASAGSVASVGPSAAGADGSADAVTTPAPPTSASSADVPAAVGATPPIDTAATTAPAATSVPPPSGSATMRRGLPRVHGGEPWPPASASVAGSTGATASAPLITAAEPVAPTAPPAIPVTSGTPSGTSASAPAATRTPSTGSAPAAPSPGSRAAEITVRRGLPRTRGGDPWPPADVVPARAVTTEPPVSLTAPDLPASASPTAQTAPAAAGATPTPGDPPAAPAPAPADAVAARVDLSRPLPFTRTVWPGRAPRTTPAAAVEPRRIGPFTRAQWAGAVVVGGIGILYGAAMLVLAMRWFASTEPMQAFLTAFPGEYHLPEGAPVGLPAWLGWQHFFNVFLMVLIIRTGFRVRTEKRPTAFWAPRTDRKRKISLNLWFHQSLDILWIVNGLVFVVLLWVTGQWMRIVPTSWEVFPNALSAGIQYLTLDWPTENGWVNYNSLQQLAYFATVFLAAPLAILTGVRMSGVWPKNNKALNKAYPVEWARAVHFPVMLYFVLFIFVHVVLVFSTGALRNLNHMYAAQGSVDPNAYADNWAGFWIFVVSLVVIAGAWVAARPLVLAPIARLFGSVSGR
ncbi:hypothetical protein GCM10009816_11170 [Microbacterium aquimaris]|nr:cytochrome b/b6 domain-containing protein [Microbacterium aquimaris]